ncbi:hypothetical protein GVN18_11280 [Pseudomonas sp. ODNR1LW]|nr:hypothetical protein [Pseudomonas sp. ODNR1LW]
MRDMQVQVGRGSQIFDGLAFGAAVAADGSWAVVDGRKREIIVHREGLQCRVGGRGQIATLGWNADVMAFTQDGERLGWIETIDGTTTFVSMSKSCKDILYVALNMPTTPAVSQLIGAVDGGFVVVNRAGWAAKVEPSGDRAEVVEIPENTAIVAVRGGYLGVTPSSTGLTLVDFAPELMPRRTRVVPSITAPLITAAADDELLIVAIYPDRPAGKASASIHAIELANGELRWEMASQTTRGSPVSMAMTPQGLAVGYSDGRIDLVDVQDGSLTKTLEAQAEFIETLHAVDGALLARSRDGLYRVEL